MVALLIVASFRWQVDALTITCSSASKTLTCHLALFILTTSQNTYIFGMEIGGDRRSNAVARHVVKYRVPQVGSQKGRFVADRFAVQRVHFLLKERK